MAPHRGSRRALDKGLRLLGHPLCERDRTTTKDFAVRMHGVFGLALAARAHELQAGCHPDRMAFVLTHMVDALCHGAVLRRPTGLSLAEAREEIVRAVIAYVHAPLS